MCILKLHRGSNSTKNIFLLACRTFYHNENNYSDKGRMAIVFHARVNGLIVYKGRKMNAHCMHKLFLIILIIY
jgi:hypothetical protein